MLEISRNIRNDHANYEQRQKPDRTHFRTEIHFIQTFHRRTEEIKRKHIEEQMSPIGVQETGGKKPVPLVIALYAVRMKNPALHKFRTFPGIQGNGNV